MQNYILEIHAAEGGADAQILVGLFAEIYKAYALDRG